MLPVDSAGEVLGDIWALIFIDSQSNTYGITKRVAGPVGNLERAAFRPPAASAQRSDSVCQVLDSVDENGCFPWKMSSEQDGRPAYREPDPSDPRIERMNLPDEFAAELLGVIVHRGVNIGRWHIEVIER